MPQQRTRKPKWLRIILISVRCLIILPITVVLGILVALTVPSVQEKAARLAADILSEKTGIEASVGHFSVRLPFDVLLEDVYAGDRNGDTLAFVGRLDARIRIDALPDSIAVKSLKINNLIAHSGDLVPSVKIDGRISRLSTGVRAFGLKEQCFRLENTYIKDADLSIELRDGEDEEEESPSDSTSLIVDLGGISLENVRFSLLPNELYLDISKAEVDVTADLGKSCYTVRSFDVADTDFSYGKLEIPVCRFSGDVLVDLLNSYISSKRMVIDIPEMQTEASLQDTWIDLEKMCLNTAAEGNIAGSEFLLKADYDINDENFKADLNFSRTDLAEFLHLSGSELVLAGHVRASGSGIDPADRRMSAEIVADMDSCRFNGIDISGMNLSARLKSGSVNGKISAPVHYRDTAITAGFTLDSRFGVSDFMGKFPGIDLDAELGDIDVGYPDDTIAIDKADIIFKSNEGTSDLRITMPGIGLSASVPAHALEIPSLLPSFSGEIETLAELDSLIAGIPAINADLDIRQYNPFRNILQKKGLDLTGLAASLHSKGDSRELHVSLKTPDLDGEYRLPAMDAVLSADMSGSRYGATLKFNSDIKDGLMSIKGIDTGIDLTTTLTRDGDDVKIDGDLKLANLIYDGKNIGDRYVLFNLRPDNDDPDHFIAKANLDEIPVELIKQFATVSEDIGLQGKIMARATVTGIPDKINLSAWFKPVDVAMEYFPYDVLLRMGEQEVTLEGNNVKLNGLSIYGADSTVVVLDGGMDLGSKLLDISLKSDGFEPLELPENGPVTLYGKLIAGIDGGISGPADSLSANIDFHILPQTDITYPIDSKNLVQISPAGTINVAYNSKTGALLGGRLDATRGELFYSPKLYPMMPFSIDKGSHIIFNGSLEDTELAISASQSTKSTYKPRGEVSRKVDFITGVKVGGTLKNLDIGFFLDAPKDSEIQRELEETSEEDREGLAAVLLATGMYASESNEAAQMQGYALSSILQSKLNAATSNRFGNTIDLDFGIANARHGKGTETTDYTINVSKNFFDGKLNVKLGGSVSDNAEINKNSTSFINNLSAEYKLDTSGIYKARLFSLKDYNNIVEGELIKSGAGILIDKTLNPQRDSLDRSLDIEFEGNVVQRSNNQLGPDMAVSLTKQNIFSRNDIFTAKLKGAYYWNLNRRQLKDPARNDTFVFGADFTLNFPFMQLGDWALKHTGQTLYRLGYLNENISGDYGIHKLYGGVDYSIRQSKYVTHSFSPLYLSIVMADRASEELAQQIDFVELLKLFVNNEFIPSTRYSFNYNNYRDKNRDINTALDIQLKESGNLISGIMAACGRDFNERYKQILGINYDQFVKFKLELRNKYRLNEKLELATRAIVGAVITYGNSVASPLSEAFSIGGPNSIRAFSPRSLGPGDFHNENYSSYIFHTGDMKLELNTELRFPLIWKLNGAVFVDAGNIWDQRNPRDYLTAEEIDALLKGFNLTHLYHSDLQADTFLKQIALGTGMGLRLDYESIVIRLDLGVAIHAPYDTGRKGYYNIPNFWNDGLRFNFGIGYPF